jgi:hypothetical protein
MMMKKEQQKPFKSPSLAAKIAEDLQQE